MRLLPSLLALLLSTSLFAAPRELTFTNKEEGGKKVWLPSTAEFKAGEEVSLKLVNTLKDVHGFEIPGVSEAIPVPAGETKTITVKIPKAGEYPFRCHMHPAHVGGSITVKE